MENALSYQKTLDDLLEFKKLSAKLENALEKKQMEFADLARVYQDLKDLYEKTKNECNETNLRLQAVYSDKSLMEKKYEAENQKLKAYFDKQKETYENQILKLRSYDSIALKNKLIAEAEIKYTQVIKFKDFEIDSLQDKYKQSLKDKDSIAQEYIEYKDQKNNEIIKLNMSHKQEIKELYASIDSIKNNIKESNKEQPDMKYYQNEIDSLRKQVLELTKSIISIKSEKEILLTDINSQKGILFKEVEGEKFKRELIEKENSQLALSLKSMQSELTTLNKKYGNALQDMNSYKNERDMLCGELNEKQSEFSMVKEEIKKLRGLINTRENEANERIKESEDKLQNYLNYEKNEKTDYQGQIEDSKTQIMQLKISYKNFYENATMEKEEIQKEYYLLMEEKKQLIHKQNELQNEIGIIKIEFEKKVRALSFYEQEYLLLDQRYRDLSNASSEKEVQFKSLKNQFRENEKELENLNAYIDKLKHENKTMANSDLNKRYKELLKKKRHYKEKCKRCNENISIIIKKLSPNDKKELGINSDLLKEISQSEDSVA